MNTTEFKSLTNAHPFRPFRVRFGSGQTVDVIHRDFVLLSPSNRTVFVYSNVGKDDEECVIIDVMLIESAEFLPTKQNGKKKSA